MKFILNCLTCRHFLNDSRLPVFLHDLLKERTWTPKTTAQDAGLDVGGPLLCKNTESETTKAILDFPFRLKSKPFIFKACQNWHHWSEWLHLENSYLAEAVLQFFSEKVSNSFASKT